MPMFYTPKPKRFHYKPRFYDPEKEEWENLKAKYHLEKELAEKHASKNAVETSVTETQDADISDDKDLEYFRRKMREMDRKEREQKSKLTLKDLFRKREKPQFHYVSRFDENGNLKESVPAASGSSDTAVKRRINRRFSDDDLDGLEPVPAGKIMIYGLVVFILLLFIFGF